MIRSFSMMQPPAFVPPQRKRDLPGRIKGVLGMKACAAVGMIVLSAILLFAFNDRSKWPDGMTPEIAHRFANLTMVATAASLAEILGVAGTWTFKRWGIYVISASTMVGFMARVSSGDKIGALVSLVTTVLAGAVISTRWSDFD